MPTFKLIVFSNPKNGQEDAYNDWYSNVHLRDVAAVAGVTSAQRFKLRTVATGEFRHDYLAIYELEADDPEGVMRLINERSGTEAMVIADAIDAAGTSVAIMEPISGIVYSPK